MNQRIEQTYWRVLYTNTRTEMKVAQRLEKIGVEAYCPARMEMHPRSDRKKKIWVPLLPSMVLVNIDKREKNKVFEAKLSVPGDSLVVKKKCKSFEEGVDTAVHILERQLKKRKEKIRHQTS